ncbi:MAG: hypothetical protein Q4B32_09030 [Clostridia bacterium]|nr:hypothetical protein [Clostridia bacterium]
MDPMMNPDTFVDEANMGLDISMEYHGMTYYVGRHDDHLLIMTDLPNENVMYAKDASEFLRQYKIEGRPLQEVLPMMKQVWN